MMSEFWKTFTAEREAHYQSLSLKLNLHQIKTAKDLPRDLVLHEDASLHVYYAPFGLLPPKKARLLIVGLTPGFQQAYKSYENFQAAAGDRTQYERLLIQNVVYAGSTRSCLIAYLDELGIAEALDIPSTASLFHERADLMMPCSLLRYPVFIGPDLKNYGGTDSIHKRPFIQSMIQDVFFPFLQQQDPRALIVPLGKYPALALRELTAKDGDLESRTLFGFPHTSGSNAHRRGQFAERKAAFIEKVKRWAQDG